MNSNTLPNINTILSDDCFRLIFSQFSLTELLHLRATCTRWQAIIELIFIGRRSLKLFESHGDIAKFTNSTTTFKVADTIWADYPSFADIGYDGFLVKNTEGAPESVCRVLPELFPNVQMLVIYCPQILQNSEFSSMIRKWAPQLTTLIIFAMTRATLPESFWNPFTQMSNLTRLQFLRMHQYSLPRPFPLLAQLKHFTVVHYRNDIMPVLGQLKSCESLKLAWMYMSYEQVMRLIEENEVLVRGLKMLGLGMISSPGSVNRIKNFQMILKLICDNFVALQTLDIISTDQLPLTTLIPILAQLPALTFLLLYIGHHQLDYNPSKLYTLPQLPSIKTLFIEIHNLTRKQFCHWIPALFPNVEKLTIKIDCNEQQKEELREGAKEGFKMLKKIEFK